VRLTSILLAPLLEKLPDALAFLTKLSCVAAKPTPMPKPERRKKPRRSKVGKACDKPRCKRPTKAELPTVLEAESDLRVNNM
jgi:hypothetical protein